MTKIEWTDKTWNPTTGCDKVSQGCKHCYAEPFALRLQAMGKPAYKNGFKLTLHPDRLDAPLHWKKPRMVFVNSMSDLFHPDVPGYFIVSIFEVMAACPQHTFQILTKRPERIGEVLFEEEGRFYFGGGDFLPNVWMGTSCEDQETFDRRKPYLEELEFITFLSLEPLLGPIDVDLKGIDWVIVGGESGPGARPMNPDWARLIRDQCVRASVPFFMKQICNDRGRKVPFDEWPDDLKIREFPKVIRETGNV